MPTAGPLPFLVLALQLFSTGAPCLVSHRASARKKGSVNDQTLCVVVAGCCQSLAVFNPHLVILSNLIFFFSLSLLRGEDPVFDLIGDNYRIAIQLLEVATEMIKNH